MGSLKNVRCTEIQDDDLADSKYLRCCMHWNKVIHITNFKTWFKTD